MLEEINFMGTEEGGEKSMILVQEYTFLTFPNDDFLFRRMIWI
jgi:hypothetical protein